MIVKDCLITLKNILLLNESVEKKLKLLNDAYDANLAPQLNLLDEYRVTGLVPVACDFGRMLTPP